MVSPSPPDVLVTPVAYSLFDDMGALFRRLVWLAAHRRCWSPWSTLLPKSAEAD